MWEIMQLYLLHITLFLVLSFIILVHHNCTTIKKPRTTGLPLPPGRTGWPIIGETGSYLSMAKKGLQHRFIADRVIKYSSPEIFKTSLLGETMAIMCTPEGNKFLFSNENKLVQAWWPPSFQKIFNASQQTIVLTESTKKFRRLVAPSLLKPHNYQHYVPVMDHMTKQHMNKHWKSQEMVKVQALVRHHAFTVACRLFLSIDDGRLVEKLEKMVADIAVGMVSLPVNLPGTNYRRALKASRAFHKEILGIIKQRKNSTEQKTVEQNLLSLLMMHNDEDGEFLTERDIADKVLSFVFPAHDTTSTTIVSIVNYLAELPQIYDEVLREQMDIANSKGKEELLIWEDIQKMKYSWNVAREVLRLTPPGSGGYREAIVDFNYQGFLIPKGWKLHWNVYATHMNPSYFPDPEKFDPSRFEAEGPTPYAYVPFGGGFRMCPGTEFAKLEILVFMHNLVTKYKYPKIFPNEKIVCDPIPAPTKGLPIRLCPHQS